MEDTKNLRALAKTAYESENYEQAHRYYSRLLESDPSDERAWIGKGLAAGRQSTPKDHNFKELSVSIQRAQKNGLRGRAELKRVSDEVVSLSGSFLEETYRAFQKDAEKSQDETHRKNTAYEARRIDMKTARYSIGGEYADDWFKGIDVMKAGVDLAPSLEKCERLISEIDRLVQHSNENMNYLDDGSREKQRSNLSKQRGEAIEQAQELDPNFSAQPEPQSSGCFIATATMGSYEHPHVLKLRRFRDEALLPNRFGRVLVKTYYTLSPPLAGFIERHPRAKKLSLHLVIEPLVKLISRLQR